MGFSDGSGISWTTCKQSAPRPRQTQRRRQGGGGLGRAKPSQLLKLAPTKHDGRSSATCELPQKIFACWRFSHSRAGAAISRTLAILNSAGTNFINYLLNVKVRTEWGKFAAFVVHPEAKRFSASGGASSLRPPDQGLCSAPDPRNRIALAMPGAQALPPNMILLPRPWTDNHTNTPISQFLQAGCSSWRRTNSVKEHVRRKEKRVHTNNDVRWPGSSSLYGAMPRGGLLDPIKSAY